MKTIYLLSILSAAILFGCESKNPHSVVEIDGFTKDGEEFTTYRVDNDYSLSVPSVMIFNKDGTPDRFSFEYMVDESVCFNGSVTYRLRAVSAESDAKEVYEERRNKQGNLTEYPFTLEGLLELSLTGEKEQKYFRVIEKPREISINGMPALITHYEAQYGELMLSKNLLLIQGTNGKIYRMQIMYTDGLSGEWIPVIYNSFKIID